MEKKLVISEPVGQTVESEIEGLLTAEQVAPILQLKPQTIRDAAWRRKLPCVKLWTGKKKSLLRFKKSQIEQFIKKRTVPAK